jgi:hypothetical protein
METILLDEKELDNIYSGDAWTAYLCAYLTPIGMNIAVMVDEIVGTVEHDAEFTEDGEVKIPDEINGLWVKTIDGGDKIVGYDKIIDSNYKPLKLSATKEPSLEEISTWLKSIPFSADNAEEIINLWLELFGIEGTHSDPQNRPEKEPEFQQHHRGKTSLLEHIPENKLDEFASAIVNLSDRKWLENKGLAETEIINSINKDKWIFYRRNHPAEKTTVYNVKLKEDILFECSDFRIFCIVRPNSINTDKFNQIKEFVEKLRSTKNKNWGILIFCNDVDGQVYDEMSSWKEPVEVLKINKNDGSKISFDSLLDGGLYTSLKEH